MHVRLLWLAVTVVTAVALSACGADTDHPSYLEGYDAGLRPHSTMRPGAVGCEDLMTEYVLLGTAPAGGDFKLAKQGCLDAVRSGG